MRSEGRAARPESTTGFHLSMPLTCPKIGVHLFPSCPSDQQLPCQVETMPYLQLTTSKFLLTQRGNRRSPHQVNCRFAQQLGSWVRASPDFRPEMMVLSGCTVCSPRRSPPGDRYHFDHIRPGSTAVDQSVNIFFDQRNFQENRTDRHGPP